MSLSSTKPGLDGWLIAPEGIFCYRFYHYSESFKSSSKVFVEKWISEVNGQPSLLQKKYELPLDEALEICGKMLLMGWKKLEIKLSD